MICNLCNVACDQQRHVSYSDQTILILLEPCYHLSGCTICVQRACDLLSLSAVFGTLRTLLLKRQVNSYYVSVREALIKHPEESGPIIQCSSLRDVQMVDLFYQQSGDQPPEVCSHSAQCVPHRQRLFAPFPHVQS